MLYQILVRGKWQECSLYTWQKFEGKKRKYEYKIWRKSHERKDKSSAVDSAAYNDYEYC